MLQENLLPQWILSEQELQPIDSYKLQELLETFKSAVVEAIPAIADNLARTDMPNTTGRLHLATSTEILLREVASQTLLSKVQ